MKSEKAYFIDPDEEALQDLKELEGLVPHIPQHFKDLEFQAQVHDLIEDLQDLCPYTVHSQLIRKLVAQFGEAYFFFNKTGDVCFLSDFLHVVKSAESAISH